MNGGFFVGVIIGCLLIGALYGLIPFFVGRRRDMNGLGVAGLLCSMLGNVVFTGCGLFAADSLFMVTLAPFIAVIFTVIILVKSR